MLSKNKRRAEIDPCHYEGDGVNNWAYPKADRITSCLKDVLINIVKLPKDQMTTCDAKKRKA